MDLKEFYENRVHEIMDRFLKNIKTCDQGTKNKKVWEPSTRVPSTTVLEPSTTVLEHDDIRDIK